jgi:CRP/FNR family transcriptional regulator
MFVLQAGLVKLSRRVDSNRDLIVRVVRPGELFGDRVFAGESARECTAESLADCVVYEMAHEEFVTQCKEHPELWNWVAAQLERRIEEVERRLHLVSFCRVEQRILVLLADLASAFPDHETHGPQIPLAQAEIASLIGATRETTSSTLNQLERRGLLILGRRHVEVPSVQALRNAASSENHRSQV